LLNGLPFLEGKFASQRAYSETTLEEVLKLSPIPSHRFEVAELRSMVLLNRGDRFEARPLPLPAQFAPAFTPVVADFNGDGREDLFLSQNYFATRPGVPRLDAGRGLLLLGDGQGGFGPMSGQDSGILVYGEQRGAATSDFDHDGRPDLVVTQNGASTRLFRNTTGKPGLRIRLAGPPGNPNGIGARIRLKSGETLGPARELHAGCGIGSQDGSVQVMATHVGSLPAQELEVQWPGGRRQTVTVPAGSKEIEVKWGQP
jgi:hypothetical protein